MNTGDYTQDWDDEPSGTDGTHKRVSWNSGGVW